MSKDKANKADLKKVEKKDKKNSAYTIKEGMEDSAATDNDDYPAKDENDKQYNHQPEFIEPYSNESKKKSEE